VQELTPIRRNRLAGAAAFAASALLFAACSNAGTGSTGAPSTAAATQAPASAGATAEASGEAEAYEVELGDSDKYGKFLTGEDGKTLYLFMPDTATTSACNTGCVDSWPPFTIEADETVKGGDGTAASERRTQSFGSSFDENAFLARVKDSVEKNEYCVVVVSEGARYADGRFLAEAGGKDAFGHAQLGGVGPLVATLVKEKLAYKYHWAVADYLQRAARHVASKTDLDHSYAVGRAAVLLAIAGQNAVMPAIVRTSDKPYRWKVAPVPLTRIANVEKMLPRDYITSDGYGITAKARAYLAPLIRGEDFPPFKDGLPQYVRLANAAVPKKLGTEFKI